MEWLQGWLTQCEYNRLQNGCHDWNGWSSEHSMAVLMPSTLINVLQCVGDGCYFWVLALEAIRICEVVQTPSTKLLEQMSGVWM